MPIYRWADPNGTGNYIDNEEFGGDSLPSGWSPQSSGSPGQQANEYWDASNSVVGGGTLTMTTRCFNPDRAHSVNWCEAGGVYQNVASGYWQSSDVQYAVEARVTGTLFNDASGTSDAVSQLGAYGRAWPPEIDFNEASAGAADSFNSYLHCNTGNESTAAYGDDDPTGQQDAIPEGPKSPAEGGTYGDDDDDGDWSSVAQQAHEGFSNTTIDLASWNTYEVDWTPSNINVWITTPSGEQEHVADWTPNDIQRAGYVDHACVTYWPPLPASAMGLFLQTEVLEASGLPGAGTSFGLQVDWVSEQAITS